MNTALWNSILAFDFDEPPVEYGFSTRLAMENYWTSHFTQQAILEYKKFMYLAATTEQMVSPSHIVDTVWHQHLVFTQSYQEFCSLIGKQVQHIPSTHNKDEFEKFRLAKERTKKIYTEVFGEQPEATWGYHDMYDSLHLPKAKYKIRWVIVMALLAFFALIIPSYFLLRPLYVQIDNPYFMIGFMLVSAAVFGALELYNRYKLKAITGLFSPHSFVADLSQEELMFLRSNKIDDAIHSTTNELVKNGAIIVDDKNIQRSDESKAATLQQLQVLSSLREMGVVSYFSFLRTMKNKPIFRAIGNCMNAFVKYFTKSKAFGQLFYTNLAVFLLLLLIGVTRLVTGLMREKQIILIAFFLLILTALAVVFLHRLTKMIGTITIPSLYREKIKDREEEWNYFLWGPTAYTLAFLPLVTHTQSSYGTNGDGSSGGCGSSCGSCGSSCSSCGGCGD